MRPNRFTEFTYIKDSQIQTFQSYACRNIHINVRNYMTNMDIKGRAKFIKGYSLIQQTVNLMYVINHVKALTTGTNFNCHILSKFCYEILQS